VGIAVGKIVGAYVGAGEQDEREASMICPAIQVGSASVVKAGLQVRGDGELIIKPSGQTRHSVISSWQLFWQSASPALISD
jgi:hypothetical protein